MAIGLSFPCPGFLPLVGLREMASEKGKARKRLREGKEKGVGSRRVTPEGRKGKGEAGRRGAGGWG